MIININDYIKNGKIFFTSDIELAKPNIIQLDKRPFQNEEEMYNVIKNNWNSKVSKNDLVIILGDLGKETEICSKFLYETNGKKILIMGNNDNYLEDMSFDKNKYLLICDLLEFDIDDKSLILTHYPMQDWVSRTRGKIHIHGHVHGYYENKSWVKELGILPNRYNCCQSENNYFPMTLDELILKYGYILIEEKRYTTIVKYN